MSRLSYVFCIMPSHPNFRVATRLQPALFAHYPDLERRSDYTLSPSDVRLPELTGISPAAAGHDDPATRSGTLPSRVRVGCLTSTGVIGMVRSSDR